MFADITSDLQAANLAKATASQARQAQGATNKAEMEAARLAEFNAEQGRLKALVPDLQARIARLQTNLPQLQARLASVMSRIKS